MFFIHDGICVFSDTGGVVVPDAKMGGYVTIEIEIDENPLIDKSKGDVVSSTAIPSWIKNNAGWWAEGSIDDNSFVQGIQFLIEKGIMRIPSTTQGSSSGSNEIPPWIKNNAGWWADGSIDDESFVGGIQFLIEKGIMRISS